MVTLYMPIGLPGSGKTTYFNTINNPRIILLSGDNERGCIGCVRRMLIKKAEMLVKAGISVYFDSPNITKLGRREVIERIRNANPETEIIGVWCDTSVESCLQNNKNRGSTVPEERIIEMYTHLEPPSIDEGFTEIKRIKKESVV